MSNNNNVQFSALRFLRALPFHISPGITMMAFLVACSLIFVSASIWSFWDSYHHLLVDAEKNVTNLSVAMSRQAEDTFVPIEVAIDDMLRELSQTGMLDSTRVKSVLDTHRAVLPQLVGFYLFDEKGNLISSTGKGPLYIYNSGRREYFSWLRENNTASLFIGKVTVSTLTRRRIIPVAKRINGPNGEFKGVFLATIDHNYFGNFYSYFSLDYNGVLSLMNADGHAIYLYPNREQYINSNFSDGGLFEQSRLEQGSGSGTWRTTLDNKVRIVGYVKLKRYPLVVAASLDRDALQARWLTENMSVMVINIMVLFVMFSLGGFVLKQIRLTVRNKEAISRLHQEESDKNKMLQKLALIDPLTKLANRRRFDLYLEQSLTLAREEGGPLSLIMLDVDFFKRYNDTYGHVLGDRCLTQLGSVLNGLPLPTGALTARYGGEEFAIILPGMNGEQAAVYGEQVVGEVRRCALPHQASLLPDQVVTVSVGVYSHSSDNPCDIQRLKEGADQALYLAKKKGRDRCVRL
ncbi:GGDEF domain-containing protein [Dickeya dianthicola]|uniref:sensor domain-containing diguanylate cyclase n=1 Tax=Dickeya dianthicola TaxID=204039 RepID=UPI00136854F9|nr:sensor domain-containing diguanylate cyclase [Dickeya dianthicola]MCI4187771.1 sensor domain-containing diguanylate cyclase [Dickeya dianthicola]MCI4237442.1 sensor domain-containing diguanylate cyclase [Dickeya dianthicola]MCI4255938.1 sensor domain-containing diguanylate cyclase [Dickeya dianthicola]MZG21363.1 GGDEF domain-containing protein [Dickeya dianthicola]MZI89037.1 GGDEF domain-containing protein [Dickeya dianthicola]